MNRSLYIKEEEYEKLRTASKLDHRSINSFIVKGALDFAERINAEQND